MTRSSDDSDLKRMDSPKEQEIRNRFMPARQQRKSATVTTTELRKLLQEVQQLKNEHNKAHTATTQLIQENKSLKSQVEELHTQNKELFQQLQNNKRASSTTTSPTRSFEKLPQLQQNKQT